MVWEYNQKVKLNIWTLLFVFLILYLIFQIREDLLRFKELNSEKEKLTKGISAEQQKNRQLLSLIKELNRPYFMEGLARERLNLIKRGETAYKICQRQSALR